MTTVGRRAAVRSPGRDLRTIERVVAAVLMPIGPAAVAILRFLILPEPVGESVAAQSETQRVEVWLGMIALFTLLPGAFCAIRLIRRYTPTLSLSVGATLVPGYLGLTALFGLDVAVLAATQLGLNPVVVDDLAAQIQGQPTVMIMTIVFIVGHITGTVLLGIASYCARLMPRTFAVLLAVSQPIHLLAVILVLPWLDLIGWCLTAVGMGLLGVRVAQTSNTEWDPPVPHDG